MAGKVSAMRIVGDRIIPDEVQDAVEFESTKAYVKGALTADAATTITAALLNSGIIRRTGTLSGVFNDTFDTAALIIAALNANGGFPIGASKKVYYHNGVATHTATLVTATGLTLTGTMTVATGTHRQLMLIRTGAATVEIVSLGTLAA